MVALGWLTLARWHRGLGAVALALLVLTNAFSWQPQMPTSNGWRPAFWQEPWRPGPHGSVLGLRFYLASYLKELTISDWRRDIYEATLDELGRLGEPDAVIVALPPYAAEPLIFYTRCTFADRITDWNADLLPHAQGRVPEYA